MTGEPLYLQQLQLGPMQNFVYLIGDPGRRVAAVIDPGWEVPTILETLRRDDYRLTGIFLTHHHFDHSMGVADLLSEQDLPVYVHRDDVPYLDVSRSSLKPMSDGEAVALGALKVTLIHTPGHTPGSQCLLVGGRLFSGDTLFVGSCGRSDLPGGDPAQLYDSLTNRIKPLDDEMILCPGHHYGPVPTVKLGDEKRTNPCLQAESRQQFLHLVGG